MKIAVITDSSAGVSTQDALDQGIYVARMPLVIDDREFMEESEVSRADLINAMRLGSSVKTSQPPLGQLIAMFDSLLESHDHIIFLPISSKLSGSYQTAMALVEDYDGRLTVIDSLFVSAPLYYATVEVKRMADMGMDPDAIRNKVEKESWMYASLIPDDIVYLKRGGRISSAAAAIANLLKIVPVLKVYNGEIDLADKVRTHKKAVKVGIELAMAQFDPEHYEVVVLDGDCDPKMYQGLVKDIESKYGITVIQRELYPIVMAHTGPGSVAISVRKKLI